METLSAYARQFLDQMERPEVDSIDGLSPAISIEQKTTSRSPRSTVGTITEIYDYLRAALLLDRRSVLSRTAAARSRGRRPEQIVQHVMALKPGERVMILAPVVRGRKGEYKKDLEKLRAGRDLCARVSTANCGRSTKRSSSTGGKNHTIEIVVDRLLVKPGIE